MIYDALQNGGLGGFWQPSFEISDFVTPSFSELLVIYGATFAKQYLLIPDTESNSIVQKLFMN